ncbi:MAG: hypothetical protein V3U98_06470 [Acidobacteriota bacterium]
MRKTVQLQWTAAVLVLLSSAVFALAEGKGKQGTIEGEIVDTACYLNMGKRGDEHRKCAVLCSKDGIPTGVLASNGKMYTLLAPSAGLADYQAQQARVTGTIYEDSNAISPKKIELKKDGKWVEVPLPETMM